MTVLPLVIFIILVSVRRKSIFGNIEAIFIYTSICSGAVGKMS